MTSLTARTLLSAAIAGSMVLAGAAGAQASDDRWERDHWMRGQWEREHHRHVSDHHVHVVQERYVEVPPRVVYQRPVMIVPAPTYQAPAYAPPVEPSLNLNFTIPLR